MKRQIFKSCILLLMILGVSVITKVSAQQQNQHYRSYINKYASLASEHRNNYNIPVSIKLAQAILETGGGRSDLASKYNNHFGIKCNKDWTGRCITKSDDRPDDKFRVYNNAKESYEDHSIFLLKPRYKKLFDLKTTDYKGWAHGLKECGYATDPRYPDKLITIIEEYKLYEYDRGKVITHSSSGTNRNTGRHQPIIMNGMACVVIKDNNTTIEEIAKDFNFKAKDLRKWNDIFSPAKQLKAGDIVYFKGKKSKADKPFYVHAIQSGESLHDISQKYGVTVKSLYKMNNYKDSHMPKVGDTVRLR
ncbi:LysM peptidoglycan-binding domain-containing protein [Dysgonomonas sp. 216]|uniref:glucosaminidase domain-containing protein n=1 Tax=Dysgonomonas sp. 216 TaxID=2302934 RepID=UPI0013D5A858|nr:glucosaminidase domain-containing protein [Dysgonomonas sp. 216]NDW17913.1 LysM peptidoglycan-binding domain-containing protein [Dysgonomonas sp. 216]